MKSISKLFIACLMLSSLVLSSCKKDSDPAPNVPPEEQIPVRSIALKHNGTAWTSNADTPISVFGFNLPSAGITVQGGNTLVLTGVQVKGSDTTFFVLLTRVSNLSNLVGEYPVAFSATSLVSVLGGGTPDLSALSSLALFGSPRTFRNLDFSNPLSLLSLASLGANGSIKITKHDTATNTVNGTFSWNQSGNPAYQITEGRFNQITIQ
ncbi:MAG: hypothetical protein ACOVMN_09935 [Flexibacteraceae bacterium]